ncbi:NADP-specific glutamate dehydrogenase [Marinicauda pacifica]|jgi:glutamate dehydrogenase (NADP+)|uniref:NADP-specific glutamate dehydrogenase n=1 Tax=Marinicauda pacifica TaxID=1133559 RepID=UPI0035C7DDAD
MTGTPCDLDMFMDWVSARSPGEDTYHQAVRDVARDVLPLVEASEAYGRDRVLERLAIPDRVIAFRVVWQNDEGGAEVHRGWRVQACNAVGPYKGGLRFHPEVTLSDLKFLAFDQTLKNALTGLSLGGGKGGSDFDPKGRSDSEIMRFCQAFMGQLWHFTGPRTDIPAGDINVGEREIGYLFGAYKNLRNEFEGSMTGKGLSYGGSRLRTEATGYGLVYFLKAMLEAEGRALDGQRAAISGAGNVAIHAAEKAIEAGAQVISLSNSDGTLVMEDGYTREDLAWLKAHTLDDGKRLADYAQDCGRGDWRAGEQPWGLACDVALPCATQNELGADAAGSLIDNGVTVVAEGANMPCTPEAVERFEEAGVLFGPGKAANAGGVAVSGLELQQNTQRQSRERETLDTSLREIMTSIHAKICNERKTSAGKIDYSAGANIAGFRHVADALVAQGLV